MKKLITGIVMLFSLTGFAGEKSQGIDQTLANIELEKNAVCDYTDSSMKLNFMSWSWYKESYVCTSNSGVFKVELKIRQDREIISTDRTGLGYKSVPGSQVVTKVIYTNY